VSDMTQHFVEFYSPGTFVSETTKKPVNAWDVGRAVEMSRDISERYGSKPYGFRFSTRSRSADELDSKETARSPMYYLGGIVRTAAEVLAGTDPAECILRANVECNGIKRIVVNDNSWRFTAALADDDVVLPLPAAPVDGGENA